MGYRDINEIATRDNIESFLGLMDLAARGGVDAGNVFELARRFTVSPPMRALPKGSLGHTYIRVLDGTGYDINFSLKPRSSTI